VCDEFFFRLCVIAVFICGHFERRADCIFLGNIVTLGAVVAPYQRIRNIGIGGLGRSAAKKRNRKGY